tara:strand:+ start:4069 stop:5256 length:1188 start_codon:yes stop_codon:yes gene_type:complete
MSDNISIVIPCRDDDIKNFSTTLDAINSQLYMPSEIVIVDSSQSNQIMDFISKSSQKNLFKYKRIKPSFAGLSTNIGIEMASFELIALLDTKTVPSNTWLKEYIEIIKNENVSVVFGNTIFKYTSSFQRAVRAASYGAVSHETVPGSLFYKYISENIKFKENLRAGYDIDWREKVKENFEWHLPEPHYISYAEFPNTIFSLIKKYFVYSFYTGLISSQKKLKDIYFSLILLATALVIPRWNLMLEGWDQNNLYIPDITKKYFLSLIILFLISSLISSIFQSNLKNSLGYKTLKFLLFIFIFYSVFRWNAEIALWAEDAALYIPHITKIFIFTVFSISIILRGIVKPIHKKEDLKYIFPFTWLKVGLLGLLMDLAKAPGFIFGSVMGRFGKIKSRS